MECCCSGPNLRPPLQQHHHRHHRHRILPRQAAIPHFHPLASTPSLAPAAAATRRRRIVLISSSTSSPVVSPSPAAAAPKEEPREGGALPPSSTTSASASSDGYLNTSSSGRRRRRRRAAALAAATLGIAAAAFMAGAVDGQAALALGPEGPLVEEFWDNVRRYGLYALTVSTGAIYAVLEPVVELLKSPLSAILLLVILGGSFYLLSQVLSFMVGINEFSYDYAN